MSAEFFIGKDSHTKEESVFFKVTIPQHSGAASVEWEGKADASHTKHYKQVFAEFKKLHPEVTMDDKTGRVFLDPSYVAPVKEKDLEEIAEENKEASEVDN